MSGEMMVRIEPRGLGGRVDAIASKSVAHRLLICAALADGPCEVACRTTSQDIEATCQCLEALGASVERISGGYSVRPVPRDADGCVPRHSRGRVLDCRESGSTLRFMLPVSLALGARSTLTGTGRLPQRPLSPLREQLEAHGCRLSAPGAWPLKSDGALRAGAFEMPGDVSSQFTTGLLLALSCLSASSSLSVIPPAESRPYVDLTVDALRRFGARVVVAADGLRYDVVPLAGGRLASPGSIEVEGDWSNAAFWLAAGALGTTPVHVAGLDLASSQGDRAVLDILGDFGACVRVCPGQGWAMACGADPDTGRARELHGIEIDAADVPDLVPVLGVVAACASGQTRVRNAGRLRLKESDRIATTCRLLRALGVEVEELPDGMLIHGRGGRAGEACLEGAAVPSWGDHRLAMSAAVAATRARGPVTITGAQAVAKSYPGFFEDYRGLGGRVLVGGPAGEGESCDCDTRDGEA